MLQGLDVSHWNGTVDFAKVKAAGASFVAIKATEDMAEDPYFERDFFAARDHDLEVIPYHFLRDHHNSQAQVTFHLSVVNRVVHTNLPSGAFVHPRLVSALDIELDSNERTMPPADFTAAARAWVDGYETATGRHPFAYSYRDMWEWMGNPNFMDCHAWLASYPNPIAILGFCTLTSWVIHQKTDHGTEPGVPGAGTVDLDEFNGDMAKLLEFRA